MATFGSELEDGDDAVQADEAVVDLLVVIDFENGLVLKDLTHMKTK